MKECISSLQNREDTVVNTCIKNQWEGKHNKVKGSFPFQFSYNAPQIIAKQEESKQNSITNILH